MYPAHTDLPMGPLQLAQATRILESTLVAVEAGDRSPQQIEMYKLLVSPKNQPPLPAIWRLHASFMLATLLVEERTMLKQHKAQWYLWVAKDCLAECLRKIGRDELFGDQSMSETLSLAAEAVMGLQRRLKFRRIAKGRNHKSI